MNRIRTLALLAIAAGTLSACTAAPEPSPTPTAAFASEEEAFAAAEATYRAYNDALAVIDLTDTDSLETVYAWLSDEAESSSRESFSELAAEGFTVTGLTTFRDFTGIDADLFVGEVTSTLCLDVSDVDVLDSSGDSVVSETRPDLQALHVDFIRATTPTGLTISSTQPTDGITCIP